MEIDGVQRSHVVMENRVTQTIQSHTFDNGLVLVAEQMHWLESAAFTLLVPAGSVYDPTERAGLGGFVCEMALRGAGQRDSHQLVDALDNLGVERHENVSDSHASFSGATLGSSLFDALSIYADIVRRPHLPARQLDAGRQVMLQELLSVEDDPHHKVMADVRRRLHLPPWGRPSQGDRRGIESTTIDDVQAQHQRLYRPNGCILGVAGAFDFARLKDAVAQLFADWQPVEVEPIETAAPEVPIGHFEQTTQQTHIGVAYPSVPYRDEDYFRAWAAVGALSGGMSARLFTEVREKRGLCYSVYASYHTLRHQGGVLCYAGTSADRAQETLDVLLAELDRLSEGVRSEELSRLKARIKSSLIMQQESSSARSGAVARDWYHLGRVRPMEELSSIVDRLSCEDINAYLAQHPPGDFRVVTLGPEQLEVRVGVS